MKYIIVISFFFQTLNSFCQESEQEKYPFQVLYSNNAISKSGKPINNLDFIPIDDVVTVTNGEIILVHYTGIPLEIVGDSTLEVERMHKQVRGTSTMIKYNLRPDLEYLFLTKKSDLNKSRLKMSGSCHDCYSKLDPYYPPIYDYIKFDSSSNLCLKWSSTKAKKYIVSISNLFGDSIALYTSKLNEISINVNDFQNKWEGEKSFIIRIDDEKITVESINLLNVNSSTIEYPYGCTLKQASAALLVGLSIETNPFINAEVAEEYYLLASELSNSSFYKEMLANFRTRKKR